MSEGNKRGRPGLGRGLNALLGEMARETPVSADGAPAPQSSGVRMLPVSSLSPHPDQPRRHFDEAMLDELAASIASRGLIQPIVVRPHGHDYQIVAGERRWRAAQRARLHEVPVVVRDFDDAETLEIALIENIQREDLNAIEEAQAYQRLAGEYGHTQEVLAKIVHKSRSHVANLLRLLELPAQVQSQVVDGSLSMGHARALLGSPDVETLADQVVARGLSVRETEKLARDAKPGRNRSGGPSEPRIPDADIAALERQLADLLGLQVRVAHTETGGTLTLSYSTLDQLDMVCQRLTGGAI
ncbi:ParB/RepB/Spo0J family partition protein [Sphingomonas aurantiaca]|jgi:ParB family chromosome partitioning protein|uniref:ParB family chromosome partitioning protein n=1 Tax=Sphingomonas aurantiaca TaxID=185949 RepID=A0A2T5GRF2_9SPHN|nr:MULTISPECIES: ParB/RepB/Spo0J family partition protein [Sphingomonas]KQN08307.1 chromosome partitioning protein ParB [Sphingomonas sp. Leaf28]PTQ61916.1 ParB family chromosome partitioning protein [Sphingomonas aurantiaca]RZT57331.1 ParB family chromosome partitioning protein [Sphingomonas sp. BK036]